MYIKLLTFGWIEAWLYVQHIKNLNLAVCCWSIAVCLPTPLHSCYLSDVIAVEGTGWWLSVLPSSYKTLVLCKASGAAGILCGSSEQYYTDTI